MYILAVDDERPALESLTNELKFVFPGHKIRSERQRSAAVKRARELDEASVELSYAFLDI